MRHQERAGRIRPRLATRLREQRHDADEPALARRAAAGDGAAFATLYDRYERRAYNLCYRITGSGEDAADATQETFLRVLERLPRLEGRELNFGAYVMTAARNASYDVLERRKRSTLAGDIPDSAVPVGAGDAPDGPEGRALRDAHQEQIRLANESLPARQREVLALREVGELSYDDVAAIMGMNRNSVAQLISRARINLRDGLRRTALGSVAGASPLCDRALPLLAMSQDGVLDDAEAATWLAEHLAGCATCRVRVEAMEEAGVAYRVWLPLVPALWLRGEIAEAAERVSGTHAKAGAGRGLRRVAAGGGGLLVALVAGFVAADLAEGPTRSIPIAEPVAAAPDETAARPRAIARPRRAAARRRPVAPARGGASARDAEPAAHDARPTAHDPEPAAHESEPRLARESPRRGAGDARNEAVPESPRRSEEPGGDPGGEEPVDPGGGASDDPRRADPVDPGGGASGDPVPDPPQPPCARGSCPGDVTAVPPAPPPCTPGSAVTSPNCPRTPSVPAGDGSLTTPPPPRTLAPTEPKPELVPPG